VNGADSSPRGGAKKQRLSSCLTLKGKAKPIPKNIKPVILSEAKDLLFPHEPRERSFAGAQDDSFKALRKDPSLALRMTFKNRHIPLPFAHKRGLHLFTNSVLKKSQKGL